MSYDGKPHEKNRLLESVAVIINDYQTGALPPIAADHVERWISQFERSLQIPILSEMEHVFQKTYFSKPKVIRFLKQLVNHRKWTGECPKSFWEQVEFLNLQPKGNSQRDLLALLDEVLKEECGISIDQCGNGTKFLYLDDGLFSGGRIGSDLKDWINNTAPKDAELMIAVIALHSQGRFFTDKALKETNKNSGKNIVIKWGSLLNIEDGLFKVHESDVLRPKGPGSNPEVAAYIATLGKEQTWWSGSSVGPQKFFSSAINRQFLEQQFLEYGVRIRQMCPNFNDYQRPLGNTTMRTIGFGTLFATYRNCPNNAPLVLWASDPWYPLLRRITN